MGSSETRTCRFCAEELRRSRFLEHLNERHPEKRVVKFRTLLEAVLSRYTKAGHSYGPKDSAALARAVNDGEAYAKAQTGIVGLVELSGVLTAFREAIQKRAAVKSRKDGAGAAAARAPKKRLGLGERFNLPALSAAVRSAGKEMAAMVARERAQRSAAAAAAAAALAEATLSEPEDEDEDEEETERKKDDGDSESDEDEKEDGSAAAGGAAPQAESSSSSSSDDEGEESLPRHVALPRLSAPAKSQRKLPRAGLNSLPANSAQARPPLLPPAGSAGVLPDSSSHPLRRKRPREQQDLPPAAAAASQPGVEKPVASSKRQRVAPPASAPLQHPPSFPIPSPALPPLLSPSLLPAAGAPAPPPPVAHLGVLDYRFYEQLVEREVDLRWYEQKAVLQAEGGRASERRQPPRRGGQA